MKPFTREQGNSLPHALVALMVGTLLLVPLLGHISTAQKATLRHEGTFHAQYASEAGVEYALWRLRHDAAWRETVKRSGATGVQMTLPDSVNRLTVSLRVAPTTWSFNYTLWGNSTTCSSVLDWTGAHNRLYGNVHTNRDMRIRGADTVISGTVEYVTEISGEGQVTFIPPPPASQYDPLGAKAAIIACRRAMAEIGRVVPIQVQVTILPPLFTVEDYNDPTIPGTAAYAAQQEGRYHRIEGNYTVNESGTVFDGLYYITGNLKINGNSFSGTATFVALGTIEIIGSGYDLYPYVDNLAFFTPAAYTGSARCTQPVIQISGSGVSMVRGYVYAPNGMIRVSGSGSMAGAFVGDSVDLCGEGLTIMPPPMAGEEEGCKDFDIEATAGGTVTRARVRLCEDGTMQLLSWYVTH